ncbi:MAG TPA: hypothetical protein VJ836_02705 [Candidatus Saccharimonadales bacterium]|nr:hypothetical protein [Candidatus Saccharimonadales bacterium]
MSGIGLEQGGSTSTLSGWGPAPSEATVTTATEQGFSSAVEASGAYAGREPAVPDVEIQARMGEVALNTSLGGDAFGDIEDRLKELAEEEKRLFEYPPDEGGNQSGPRWIFDPIYRRIEEERAKLHELRLALRRQQARADTID